MATRKKYFGISKVESIPGDLSTGAALIWVIEQLAKQSCYGSYLHFDREVIDTKIVPLIDTILESPNGSCLDTKRLRMFKHSLQGEQSVDCPNWNEMRAEIEEWDFANSQAAKTTPGAVTPSLEQDVGWIRQIDFAREAAIILTYEHEDEILAARVAKDVSKGRIKQTRRIGNRREIHLSELAGFVDRHRNLNPTFRESEKRDRDALDRQ